MDVIKKNVEGNNDAAMTVAFVPFENEEVNVYIDGVNILTAINRRGIFIAPKGSKVTIQGKVKDIVTKRDFDGEWIEYR